MTMYRLVSAAAFLASLLPLQAATTVTSAPYGAMTTTVPVGTAGLSFPLIAGDLFAGRISANSTAAVTFATGNVGASLTAGERYYVEIVTGPLEGERFDLNTAATIASANASATLDLSGSSNSTSNTLAVDALATSRAVIRPHVTLGKLTTMFTPALVGSNDNAVADGVRIYGGVFGLTSYYLRPDGSWRTSAASIDQRNMVISPDSSVIMAIRSGEKAWVHLGQVRANVFRKKLKTGLQSFATGFPIDLSPAQIGAFVDPEESATIRWTGSDQVNAADTLRVYDAATGTYKIQYLRADGTSWFASGGTTDLSATPFLTAPQMLLVGRTKADPGYLIIRPFSL